MLPLVKPFVNLSLLRIGPQDLPASSLLLAIVLAAQTLSAVLVAVVYFPLGPSLLAGVMDTILLVALAAIALGIRRVWARLVQTLTALAGCGVLLSIVALPLNVWLHAARAAGDDASQPLILLLALTGWSIVITAHILRHALSCDLLAAAGVAVLFYFISMSVLHGLFPLTV